MDEGLKSAIRHVYGEWGLPADHIVCDPQLCRCFTDRVNGLTTGRPQPYRIVEVNRGLLRLRKSGHLPKVGRVTEEWVECEE
jgi:hypothetical protein